MEYFKFLSRLEVIKNSKLIVVAKTNRFAVGIGGRPRHMYFK